MKSSRGFSLIELIVSLAIIGLLSTMLVFNFRSSASGVSGRNQAASVVAANVRRMQTLASSGANYNGGPACGFGIHYVDSKTYYLYAKTVSGGATCDNNGTRKYQNPDPILETKKVTNNLSFKAAFPDIFFEPPNPTVYIDNSKLTTSATIEIAGSGGFTPISIDASGRVDLP